MTPAENADIAYAMLDEVNLDLAAGRPTEFVALDIARAQVYATLATVPTRPTRSALWVAVHGALERMGIDTPAPEAKEVVEAVEALL